MEEASIVKDLKSAFPAEAVEAYVPRRLRVTVSVEKERLEDVLRRLKEKWKFDRLVSVCGIDLPEENVFEVVYHLSSSMKGNIVIVKTKISRDKPEISSVIPLFPSADWHERETHEMLGIRFKGHPNLERLLLPEDWKEGYPLRKDFSLERYVGR